MYVLFEAQDFFSESSKQLNYGEEGWKKASLKMSNTLVSHTHSSVINVKHGEDTLENHYHS